MCSQAWWRQSPSGKPSCDGRPGNADAMEEVGASYNEMNGAAGGYAKWALPGRRPVLHGILTFGIPWQLSVGGVAAIGSLWSFGRVPASAYWVS